MTGSGKTGLCIALLEEAALHGVAPYVCAIAEAEGLAAHAGSVRHREQAPAQGPR